MISIIGRLAQRERGSVALEFALVAPTFLMFLFLILDGGRMLFMKQSLNEVATATARCAALTATGCSSEATAEAWAVSRGLARDNLKLLPANVDVTIGTSCNGMSGMVKATVVATWKKGAMTLLPQSVAPSTLTSVACFPIAS